jgi:Fe-S cluster biosynthesis and repair protein YggX
MDQDERIEQFRKMAKANPDDDLAHFALGQILVDAERFAEAVPVLRHVIKMNEGYSRAYLSLGDSLWATTDEDSALEIWQTGYKVSYSRGDLMVSRGIAERLEAQGVAPEAPVPVIDEAAAAQDAPPGEGELVDHRTGRVGQALAEAPFPDEVGAYILANITQQSWDDWLEMSIKVINELRLDLGEPEAQTAYDQHMRDFLNLPGELFEGRTYE